MFHAWGIFGSFRSGSARPRKPLAAGVPEEFRNRGTSIVAPGRFVRPTRVEGRQGVSRRPDRLRFPWFRPSDRSADCEGRDFFLGVFTGAGISPRYSRPERPLLERGVRAALGGHSGELSPCGAGAVVGSRLERHRRVASRGRRGNLSLACRAWGARRTVSVRDRRLNCRPTRGPRQRVVGSEARYRSPSGWESRGVRVREVELPGEGRTPPQGPGRGATGR